MHVLGEATILSVRWHGEHGAIVRAMGAGAGMLAGYVRGGRSRRLRPVLVPGNVVRAEWRARVESQLASLAVELVHSRAPLLAEPLPAAAIDWIAALTAAVLPEGQADADLHAALEGVFSAVEHAPSARGWAAALVRYELLLMGRLGFGLDLGRCAVTGAAGGLAFVSPRTGRAVSRAGAAGYEDRLLRLPAFVLDGGGAGWEDILDGLALAGAFLDRDLLGDRRGGELMLVRGRLVERLRRAGAGAGAGGTVPRPLRTGPGLSPEPVRRAAKRPPH